MGKKKASSNSNEKKAASLESVAEDVAFIVAAYTKDWVEGFGATSHYDEERTKAIKLRASSLRSIVLSSRTAYHTWIRTLLEHVSFDLVHLHCVYSFLKRRPEDGKYLKTVTTLNLRRPFNTKDRINIKEALKHRKLPPISQWAIEDIIYETNEMLAFILSCSPNVETLVFSDYNFELPLIEKIGGKSLPLRFLTHSLKRLSIHPPPGNEAQRALPARTIIWILVFCPLLHQVVVGFGISKEDAKYLSEYRESFKGLCNAKQIAISVVFTWFEWDVRTFWGKPQDEGPQYLGSNRKSEALRNFLAVTNSLDSIEISGDNSIRVDSDNSDFFTNVVDALTLSHNTLKHLRLIQTIPDWVNETVADFTPFVKLKIFATDLPIITALEQYTHCKFPPNLEILQLPFYVLDDDPNIRAFLEETSLFNILQNRKFPNLKEVVVPKEPISYPNGRLVTGVKRMLFPSARNLTVMAKMFKDGDVKLTQLPTGQTIGDPLKNENCLSTFPWIHSFWA